MIPSKQNALFLGITTRKTLKDILARQKAEAKQSKLVVLEKVKM